MKYTEKFLALANAALEQVEKVAVEQVDELVKAGAVLLDIRDKEEHERDHIAGSLNVSRGTLEMLIEGKIADLNTPILCYCNAYNRGGLSAKSLQDMGYVNAKVIAGGLLEYRKQVG